MTVAAPTVRRLVELVRVQGAVKVQSCCHLVKIVTTEKLGRDAGRVTSHSGPIGFGFPAKKKERN